MSATQTPPLPAVGDVGESGPAAEPSPRKHTSGRTLVLFGTLLAIALMLALPIRTWLGQRAELEALSEQNTAAQQRVDALTLEQQMWRNPRFIEAQARLRLNMVRPGQYALIALDHAARADEEQPEPPPSPGTRRCGGPPTPRPGRPADTDGG